MTPSVAAWQPELTRKSNLSDQYQLTGVPSPYCDSGLLYMIRNGRRPRYWSSILGILDERTKLLCDNYAAYADAILLCHTSKWDEAWDAVENCHDLHEQRGRHHYKEFQAFEAVGHLDCDIRLTAIIHHCFPRRRIPESSPALIHRWC